jgi:hypothetical protein
MTDSEVKVFAIIFLVLAANFSFPTKEKFVHITNLFSLKVTIVFLISYHSGHNIYFIQINLKTIRRKTTLQL